MDLLTTYESAGYPVRNCPDVDFPRMGSASHAAGINEDGLDIRMRVTSHRRVDDRVIGDVSRDSSVTRPGNGRVASMSVEAWMQPFHILINSRQFNGDSTIRGAVIDGESEHLHSPGVHGTAPSESYIRKHENALVRLSVDGGARYYGDYSHCSPNATIVTDRFLTVLTALQPDGWAAVPVTVEILNRPKLNPPPDRFYIFTVVGLVDGLDEERTQYVRTGNEPPSRKLPVSRYALKPGACEGQHLFRLQQYSYTLIASEAFRQACLAQKLRGIDFEDLEQVDSS